MKNEGPFTTVLDLTLSSKLLEVLKQEGFEITKPAYTLFSGKKTGVVCTLYSSGKLVVQGSKKAEFIEFFLEPEILQNFSYTNPLLAQDLHPRIGVDESGKGDFFGPLCIGALFAGNEEIQLLHDMGVKDSKNLGDTAIKKIAAQLRERFLTHVVIINPAKYNEIYPKFKNLNSLLAWGHATAIEALVEKSGCRDIIIDQFANEWVVIDALKRKKIDLNLTQRTKGEQDLVVAGASILARDAFVFGLEKLSKIVDCPLPKGASLQVVKAGKTILHNLGEEALTQVAKKHFKTWNIVCSTDT